MNRCVFSPDRTYRYTLTHEWDKKRGMLVVIGLNPSTADENALDPTLRKVKGFADRMGYGSFTMLNLFAYRATQPADMKRQADPVGPRNSMWIARAAGYPVLAAWGTHGAYRGRDEAVMRILRRCGNTPVALEVTKGGFPKHPLYVSYEALPPTPYKGR